GFGTGIILLENLRGPLTMNGGSKGNTFTILDTLPNLTTTLNSGLGIDTVTVKGTTGPLVVNGQNGRDKVNIFSSSATSVQGDATTPNAASFSQVSVNDPSTTGRNVTMGIGADGFGFINNLLQGKIRYKVADTAGVVVNAGTGNDTFTIT